MEIVSVEGLVPQDYLLRKIDSAIDFTHTYDFRGGFLSETYEHTET